jgi:hypothetical protein
MVQKKVAELEYGVCCFRDKTTLNRICHVRVRSSSRGQQLSTCDLGQVLVALCFLPKETFRTGYIQPVLVTYLIGSSVAFSIIAALKNLAEARFIDNSI